MQLVRKVLMRLMYLILYFVDIETAFTLAVFDSTGKLCPDLLFIGHLCQSKSDPLLVGVKHVPKEADLVKGLFVASVVADEWILVVHDSVFEVDGVLVAELVEDIPCDFRGYECLAVGDPFWSEIRHLFKS